MQLYLAIPQFGMRLAGTAIVEVPAQPLALIQVGAGASIWLWLGPMLLALLVLLVAGIRLVRGRRSNAYRPRPDPPLVFPLSGGQPRRAVSLPGAGGTSRGSDLSLTPPNGLAGRKTAAEVLPATAPVLAATEEVSRADGGPATAEVPHVRPPAPEPSLPVARPPANGATAGEPPALLPSSPPASDEGEFFEGHTVRYFRPVDGNLQLLPGRLDIVEGEDSGQDIRFMRVNGSVPEVTFGRSSGPPHRHVQLRARTVSREHARMTFEEDRWRIHNLSQTNPIVVNGQELPSAAAGQTLADGDLIEMGEVVFRFREQA